MNYYVYILQSESYDEKYYLGFTTDIKRRLQKHNNGEVSYTSKYKPWELKNSISFTDKSKALAFEKYLKSHTGRVYTKKHY